MSALLDSAQKVLHPISPSKVPAPDFQPASSYVENRGALSTGTENGVCKQEKIIRSARTFTNSRASTAIR